MVEDYYPGGTAWDPRAPWNRADEKRTCGSCMLMRKAEMLDGSTACICIGELDLAQVSEDDEACERWEGA